MTYDYRELVDDLFRTFNAPVTLLDSGDRVLAFSDQPVGLSDDFRRQSLLVDSGGTPRGAAVVAHVNEVARSARSLVRTPAEPDLGLLPRTVVPLLLESTPVAYLCFIDPEERIDEESLSTFADALASVAKQVEMQRMSRTKTRSAVLGVLSRDPAERRIAASLMEELGLPALAPPFRVVVVASPVGLDHVREGAWRRALGRDSVWTQVERRTVAVAMRVGPADVAAMRDTTRISGPEVLGLPVMVGIGSEVDDLADAHQSHREALGALRLARSSGTPDLSAVWEELGAWRSVLALDSEAGAAAIDPRVRAMLTAEDAGTLGLVRHYLERDVDVDQIAAAHHLHRTTLYAKMRRLQERYDLQWDTSDDRLATVLGVRLAQLDQPKRHGADTSDDAQP